jgi:glycosyltransferase involved in cell wall biosynthesis
MIELVPRIGELDRRGCRAEAERRFSESAIIDEYETLYKRMLNGRQ